jgi:hypothetical protein
MINDEYKNKIRNYSDFLLYKEIKRYLKEEQSGYRHNSEKLDLLYDESKIREQDVYAKALDDSMSEFNKRFFPEHSDDMDGIADTPDLGNVTISSRKTIFEDIGLNGNNIFLCKVKGNSMIGAKIDDGDTLIAEKTDQVNDGDLIIAEIDNAVFVKRYRKSNDGLWLISENVSYPEFQISEETSFRVLGKVIACLKKF